MNSKMQTSNKLRNMCTYSTYLSLIDPKGIKEALLDIDWIVAVQEELNQFEISKGVLLGLKTCRKNIIGTKWVFRNK